MAQDYTKLKNNQLESLLKERNLPHTGKKAEMVQRLVDADKASPSKPAAGAAPSEKPSTEAPASAAAPKQTSAAAATASKEAKTTTGAVKLPTTASTTTTKDQPVEAQDKPAAPSDAGAEAQEKEKEKEKEKEQAAFTSGLPGTDLEAEIARRKKRAAKFGLSAEEGDAIKNLERAKRFGTGGAANSDAAAGEAKSEMKGIDEALPERAMGGRKRGREEGGGGGGGEGEDPGLIKRRRGGGGVGGFRGRGRGRGGRGGGGRRGGAGGGRGEREGGGGGAAKWMSDADRKKAETRKAKFG